VRLEPGAAWQHGWASLRLFSPSEYSALPGWPMPAWTERFPPAGHVVSYLSRYQERCRLPVHHGVRVRSVRCENADCQGFVVDTHTGGWRADAVITATGTWERPFWPTYLAPAISRQDRNVLLLAPPSVGGPSVGKRIDKHRCMAHDQASTTVYMGGLS